MDITTFRRLLHDVSHVRLEVINAEVFDPAERVVGSPRPPTAVFGVLHEGSDLASWFSYDAGRYKRIDRMALALEYVGLWSEQQSSWLSWVFPLEYLEPLSRWRVFDTPPSQGSPFHEFRQDGTYADRAYTPEMFAAAGPQLAEMWASPPRTLIARHNEHRWEFHLTPDA